MRNSPASGMLSAAPRQLGMPQHGLHQIIGRTVPLGGRPADQRPHLQCGPYGFEAGDAISSVLKIFAPRASSTVALRTRKRLGP
jgi:hypothetical protein